MPPRVRVPTRLPRAVRTLILSEPLLTIRHASTVSTPAPSPSQIESSYIPQTSIYPAQQPPSHRAPAFRKSQLHRQYASLLQTSPLIILFQHNNLTATEWSGIRRELAVAMAQVDAELEAQGSNIPPLAHTAKLNIIQTSIFEAALRVVEYFDPSKVSAGEFTHVLSAHAHKTAKSKKARHPLQALLSGPLATLSFPAVSPAHLKAALSILSPKAPDFPAPKRKAQPGYHEMPVQAGLKKLMLLGARVEGKVFDTDGTRWVGGISGGLDGLRSQLVHMLQSVGGGVTGALESASRSLYFTMESRKTMLEEEQKDEKKD